MSNFSHERPAERIENAAQNAVRAETASRPKREYRTLAFQVALFSAIGAFAVLTLMVKSTPLFSLDLQITRALQSINFPFFTAAMVAVSWPGYLPQSVLIPGLVALLIYRLGLRWEAVTVLFAAVLPGVMNLVVKELIRRPRPSVDLVDVFRILDTYSFPSGHVMFYIGFFGFLWFLAFTLFKRSLKRTLLLVLFGMLIAFVGVSRIYLGQHWASDILGATLLGGLTLAFIFQFYQWGKERFFIRQPVAPASSLATISIEPAKPEQADTLSQIALASKAHWGYPKRWMDMWKPQLTFSSKYLKQYESWVAVDGTRPVAFYTLEQRHGNAWLENLWVLPEYMGKGVGKALFSHAVEQSRERGYKLLQLEADPHAIGFYEKMGMYKISQRQYEIEDQSRILPTMELEL